LLFGSFVWIVGEYKSYWCYAHHKSCSSRHDVSHSLTSHSFTHTILTLFHSLSHSLTYSILTLFHLFTQFIHSSYPHNFTCICSSFF
jgi:hypothetical protein